MYINLGYIICFSCSSFASTMYKFSLLLYHYFIIHVIVTYSTVKTRFHLVNTMTFKLEY